MHFEYHNALPNAPTVVLIHGLFGNLDNLAVVRRGLQDTYNVLSVDLPDHGKSAHTDTFSFAQYAGQLHSLLVALDLQKVILVGHSLGGKIAMQFTLTWPELVSTLIVADIAPVAYEPRHQNVLAGLANVNLTVTKDRAHADEQLGEHVKLPFVRQFLLKSLYRAESGWRWRFNLPLLTRDYPLLSRAIVSESVYEGPVLFIKGGESDYLTADHQSAIKNLFPTSQAKILSGTGHWLHAEKPTAFNRIVSRFIDQG